MRRHVLVAAAMAGVFCGAFAANAHADVISFSDTFIDFTDWSNSLSIDKFDSANGTLQSVQLTFEAGVNVDGYWYNDPLFPTNSVWGESNATITLTLPDATTLSPSFNLLFPAGAPGVQYTVSPGQTQPFSSNGFVTSTSSANWALPTDLSSFIWSGAGPTSLALPATAVATWTDHDANTNILSSVDTQASAKVTVTYTYDANGNAVPEPSSLLSFFCVSAAYGLARVWRRRKATRASAS